MLKEIIAVSQYDQTSKIQEDEDDDMYSNFENESSQNPEFEMDIKKSQPMESTELGPQVFTLDSAYNQIGGFGRF